MADKHRLPRIPSRIVASAEPWPDSPRRVAATFKRWLDRGARLLPVGSAKADPDQLLERKYSPRYAVSLFDATFFLADFRHDEDLDFFVGYVALSEGGDALEEDGASVRSIHPRIFYKDSSLVFRVATHMVRTENENWIGKGDLKWERGPEGEVLCSAEETTNLPLEIQAAFDACTRRGKQGMRDDDAAELILRAGPDTRMRPYADFSAPRKRAMATQRVNGGRRVARFRRRNDPSTLVFGAGYEPDFRRGVLEMATSGSRLYGGPIEKYRVLSKNRKVQYQFIAAPRHAWVNPPQTLTTQLSTYGVRTIDVEADEDFFVPGYEYHYLDDSVHPPQLVSQIPPGFAGHASQEDPHRADASAWIEAMPIIQRFRREVLGKSRRA